MLLPIACLVVAVQAQDIAAPAYEARAGKVDVAIPRRDMRVTIDGRLDEPVWADAAVLTGFSQYLPVDGRPASDSTEVLAWYAPDAIYFGIRAFEPHGAVVRATLADRDKIDADDNVQILLDTYNDKRSVLEFAVNPLGVQEDGVRSEGGAMTMGPGQIMTPDGGNIDLNPDFVWQSRGHVTAWGYEVEVRIPFKSISYQTATQQDWGLQIVRDVSHTRYEDTWTPVLRANASFLVQSGRLRGLHDLHRGIVMETNPEFTTLVQGDSSGAGYRYGGTPEVGGSLRWGITNNLSLSATAHPDFSQVEADAAQVTLNQRFALFYPEKRPFFLDGLQLFDTPNLLIYTRQIVQPVAGVKLTGKEGHTNVAYLGAVDAADRGTGDHPIFNLLRVRSDLGASSTLGLVYTDRIDGGEYNRVLGSDARVVWGKVWYSQLQVAGSWTQDAAGARAGTMWDAVLGDRQGRTVGAHAEVQGISPEFAAASGFVNRTGVTYVALQGRMSWYGHPGALVERIDVNANAYPTWRYADFWAARGALEGGTSASWSATLRGGWSVRAGVSNGFQQFDGSDYAGMYVDRGTDTVPFTVPHGLSNLWSGSAGFSTPLRALTLNVRASDGRSPIFAEAAAGQEWYISPSLTWNPTGALRVAASWVHDRLSRVRDGSEFAVTDIPRLQVEYQLSRSLFVRYIGQYVAQRQAALEDPRTGQPLLGFDGASGGYAPLGAQVSNGFRNDLLLSYRPTPGTVVFLGYGASLTEPRAFALSARDLHRTSDGFFFKTSYLFRM